MRDNADGSVQSTSYSRKRPHYNCGVDPQKNDPNLEHSCVQCSEEKFEYGREVGQEDTKPREMKPVVMMPFSDPNGRPAR